MKLPQSVTVWGAVSSAGVVPLQSSTGTFFNLGFYITSAVPQADGLNELNNRGMFWLSKSQPINARFIIFKGT